MSQTLSRHTVPYGIAMLLATLAAIGPFAIDTYLPSFHDIAHSLAVGPNDVQQTLSFYLVSFSIMALWHGALSDALGRRRVILMALILFSLSSLGCVFATRIEHLWLFRACQGATAGAGIVIGRAIVRDIFEGALAQRLMSNISMMFALAPAIAPVIGGQLQAIWGWRSVFIFLALTSFLIALATWKMLPETLAPEKRQPFNPRYLLHAYQEVLSAPPFLLVCLGLSANFAAFFIYVLSAPVFLTEHLGVSEEGFLWLFGPAMMGMVLGSWLSGRLAGRLSARKTILRGYSAMAGAVFLNLFISFSFAPQVVLNILPMPLYTFGMSLAMPSLTLLSLDLFPKQRGLVSSCQMFLQSAFNGLLAGVIVPWFWSSTRMLSLGMALIFVCGTVAILFYLFYLKLGGETHE